MANNAQSLALVEALLEGEDPKDFFRIELARIAKERGEKRVAEFDFRFHGIENSSYWQGAGTTFTQWDVVFTGIGDTPNEAADDCLEQAAMDGWVVANIPNEMPFEPSVSAEAEEEHERQQAERDEREAEREANRDYREVNPYLFPELGDEEASSEETEERNDEEEAEDENGEGSDLYCYVTLWIKGFPDRPAASAVVADSIQEGKYLTKLARYKSLQGRMGRLRDAAKAQRELDNIDKPDRKKKRLNLH